VIVLDDITGRIENWVLGSIIWGEIHDDKKKRWEDGHFVQTSTITSDKSEIKKGAVISTNNSKYLLGVEK
jgi:hypothetical protein